MNAPSKICVHCGEDCSTRPRIKDGLGRYACTACVEQARDRANDAAAIDELLGPSTAGPGRPASRSRPAAPLLLAAAAGVLVLGAITAAILFL